MSNYNQISKEFDKETELAGFLKSSGGIFGINKISGNTSKNISATIRSQRGVVFLSGIL
ncbi:MAG: hypothetical protein Q8R90_09205 [Bacteroidales bacterium]|jgi:hypothetical protein|nr:hypothetical protein [Bacteroidales bacterium]